MPLMFILFDVSRHIRLYACVCVCGLACVRTSKRACVRLIERMHVCADLRECMSMGGGGVTAQSTGGEQSGAWQQQRTVI